MGLTLPASMLSDGENESWFQCSVISLFQRDGDTDRLNCCNSFVPDTNASFSQCKQSMASGSWQEWAGNQEPAR